jgi:hypothetical protein
MFSCSTDGYFVGHKVEKLYVFLQIFTSDRSTYLTIVAAISKITPVLSTVVKQLRAQDLIDERSLCRLRRWTLPYAGWIRTLAWSSGTQPRHRRFEVERKGDFRRGYLQKDACTPLKTGSQQRVGAAIL